MSLPISPKQSMIPLALALALATAGCAYRAPIPITPVTAEGCARDGGPAPDQLSAPGDCVAVDPDHPPRHHRHFSWGKALALGVLLPALLAVDLAAGAD